MTMRALRLSTRAAPVLAVVAAVEPLL